MELQPARPLAANLADLPTRCDVGCKRNSKGHPESWIGYKLYPQLQAPACGGL